MKNIEFQKLIIEAENKKTEFKHLETYKITTNNENLSSKISLVKVNSSFDEKSKKPVDNIIAVACLEDQFKFIHYYYNYNNVYQVTTKSYEFAFNSKNIGKSIRSVVLLYDKVKKRVYLAVGTEKMALVQDLDEPKSFRVLYDNISSELGLITTFYEVPPYIQTDFHMILLFNDNILMEVDINRKDILTENSISAFINKNKSDEKSKFLKFEYNLNNNNQLIYHVLISLSDKKNPKYIWKFYNESVILIKFRPKNPNSNSEFTYQYKSYKNNTNLNINDILPANQKLMKENHLAISLSSNRVCIFHYETKALISIFKSYYGSILALEFSFDGRLLAMGTESDQIYIVDPEYNLVLYCLEGHRNFITNLTFFEETVDEEDVLENSNFESNRNDNNDYNTLNSLQTIIINKEMSLEEMTKIMSIDEKSTIDIRQLRRARSSLVNKYVESEELRCNITYDLYSTSMDGMMGVWRVEHFFEKSFINEANYCFNTNSLVNIVKIVELIPNENQKIPFTSLTKISTTPIIYHFLNENSLIFIGKRNSRGSTVCMKFYYGSNVDEEAELKEKANTQIKEDSLPIVNKSANKSEKKEDDKSKKK